jgi:hypothetical protein
MGVAGDHLVGDGGDHVVEGEMPASSAICVW